MNQNREREISLKELFWYALGYWKQMLIFIIIGALVAAAYSYVQSGDSSTSTVDVLTAEEAAAVEAVYAGYDDYQKAQELLVEYEEDYLAKADMSTIYATELRYYIELTDVTAEDREYDMAQLSAAYDIYLNSTSAREELASGVTSLSAVDLDSLLTVTFAGAFIYIDVKAPDEDVRDDLLAVTESRMETLTAELSESLYAHTATILYEGSYVTTDSSIEAVQEERTTALTTQIETYETQIATLSDTQLEYYNVLVDGIDYSLTKEQTTAGTKQVSRKTVLIGAVAGWLLVILYAVLRFIFSATLLSVDCLHSLYSEDCYDTILSGTFSTSLDRKLAAHLGGVTHTTNDKLIAYMSTRIADRCHRAGATTINLVGCALATGSASDTSSSAASGSSAGSAAGAQNAASAAPASGALAKIIAALEAAGLTCNLAGDIVNDQQAYGRLLDGAPVLLIETFARSRYEDIDQEHLLCKDKGCEVMGNVVER